MSPEQGFTTPEKKRKQPSSPPPAPLKKRVVHIEVESEDEIEDEIGAEAEAEADTDTETETEARNAVLLLFKTEKGETVTYCSDHPALSGVRGYHGDFLSVYAGDLFESVLGVVGDDGYSSADREMCSKDEIRGLMKASLMKLFSEEIHGGAKPDDGQMFRGTIVL